MASILTRLRKISRAHPYQNEDRANAVQVLYRENLATGSTPRTYICLGVPRGGTSSVAGVMHRLGVPMGDGLERNHEDMAFVDGHNPDMAGAITERNARHDIWGWKFPMASIYLEEVLPLVRNPHLVVVFRDVVATSKGLQRWHKQQDLDALSKTLDVQRKNFDLVVKAGVPTALISYEKVVLFPKVFVDRFSEFLGTPSASHQPRREVVSFLKPGSYKPAQ